MTARLGMCQISTIVDAQYRFGIVVPGRGFSPSDAQVPALQTAGIEYGDGFYGEEHSATHAWRWMAAEGVVRLHNDRRGMMLKLSARAPEKVVARQATITLTFNGETLDKFKPPSGLFEKEYVLSAANQGAGGWTEMRIHASETAAPVGDSRPLGLQLYSLSWEPEGRRQPVEFGEGFYGPEKSATGTWRWMRAEGGIKLWNTRQDMRLNLRVHMPDQSIIKGGSLTLKWNGEVMDQFTPTRGIAEKEYTIAAARQGPEKWSVLHLEVDKTAVPKVTNPSSKDGRALGLKIHDLAWELAEFQPPPPPPAVEPVVVPPRPHIWLILGLLAIALVSAIALISFWLKGRPANRGP